MLFSLRHWTRGLIFSFIPGLFYTIINAKKLSFYKKRVRPIIDKYKTAKISSVTSRAVDIIHSFYSARNARIASAVLAIAIQSVCLSVCLSVRPSVCPSVRHTPILCQNGGT